MLLGIRLSYRARLPSVNFKSFGAVPLSLLRELRGTFATVSGPTLAGTTAFSARVICHGLAAQSDAARCAHVQIFIFIHFNPPICYCYKLPCRLSDLTIPIWAITSPKITRIIMSRYPYSVAGLPELVGGSVDDRTVW